MKHAITKFTGIILFYATIALFSCKKGEPVAPASTSSVITAREALPGFRLTESWGYVYSPIISSGIQGPDFSNSGTSFYFEAAFNSSVTWTITINGLSSGAIRTISGTSKTLNESNASWNGSHDGLFFFKSGEEVKALLSILGNDTIYTTNFFINTSLVPKASTPVNNVTVLGWFNDKNEIIGSNSWPAWVASPQGSSAGAYSNNPPDNIYGGQVISASSSGLTGALTGFKPVEGSGAYRLFGEDTDFGYFICGIKRQTSWFFGGGPPAESPSTPKVETFPASPQDLYINIYVYGTGDAVSQLNLTVEEDDNGDHQNTPEYEDIYQYTIVPTHTGWKLFSIPYNAFVISPSPANGGRGNHRQETSRITAFGYNLNSSPAGQSCQVIFDLSSLSFGEPFNAEKF